jgi:formylglycine-generating enzyme required for sulfatase activity
MIFRTIRCVVAAAFLSLSSATGASAQSCVGDISGDGKVDGVDLAGVLANWGICQTTPSISGVYPPVGPTTGGTPIAIIGVDLGRTASVTIDGVIAPQFSVVSATTITAVTPPGSPGPRTVVLRNQAGQEIASSTFGYSVSELPWATVIEQNPSSAVVTDAALRTKIIDTGLPWRVRDKGTGIEFVLIPPGTFQMGCSASNQHGCFSDESPVHTVTLTNAFYMGRFEVTQAQWTARMGSNPSNFQSSSAQVPAEQVSNRPVDRVSYDMIQPFLSATGMRLPTEAEWEYAYRAGTTTAFHLMPGYPNGTNDDNQLGPIAWTSINSALQTRPVGQKAGNGFGLHDMSGNLWEWVNDWHSSSYYASSPSVNPPGPDSGWTRVLRGGSWYGSSSDYRSSARGSNDPSSDLSNFGFRVARNP